MKPHKTQPALKERLWGGERLKKYNKNFEVRNIGESWETNLGDDSIPVLIKFLDANDTLSVQVHPDDEKAQALNDGTIGKTEMWIILECEEGSEIIYGFNEEMNKEKLKKAIEQNSISRYLRRVKVKKGDSIFIPAGTVHALGRGILAYEVQQPSDLTYRLYDWDRISGGKCRELHIDKALEVIDYNAILPSVKNIYELSGYAKLPLDIFSCKYFNTKYHFVKKNESYIIHGGIFRCISVIEGSGSLNFEGENIFLRKGDTAVIPKEYEGLAIITSDTGMEFIETNADERL